MHDFYYERLVEEPSKFQPRPGNRWVEVLEGDDAATPVLFERVVAESEIRELIMDDSPHIQQGTQISSPSGGHVRLRLLIGSPEQHQSDAEILPLPISRETFETIRTTWAMPKELLRMMSSTLPIATEFRTTDCFGQALSGLMVRSARSRDWNFCLGLVHNATSGVTSAILNGMQVEEIDLLLKCLRESPQELSDPMLLAVFLLELKVNYFAVLLEKRAEGIEELEMATGMRHGFSSNPRRKEARHREREKLLKELNFDEITQKLTGVTGTLSFCDMTFASSLRALGLVCTFRERLYNLPHGLRKRGEASNTYAVETRIAYLKELIAGAQAHSVVMSARTKAQVQTVYSMIGQKDNKLNVETAAASQKIAQISLHHNTAMKDMAVDSRNIAILTRKDSTDMRIIASVTLMFLPGTFMATLFSADFFNFLPNDSHQVVSKWIWLYFVLTGIITLLVFGTWYLFSKQQNKEMLTAMNTDTRPLPPRNNQYGDSLADSMALPVMPSLWTTRSRSNGDIEPFSSFGSSSYPLK